MDFKSFYDEILYYSTGEFDLSLGDEVIVPYGRHNALMEGIVVSVGKCYAGALRFDVGRLKTVIAKK